MNGWNNQLNSTSFEIVKISPPAFRIFVQHRGATDSLKLLTRNHISFTEKKQSKTLWKLQFIYLARCSSWLFLPSFQCASEETQISSYFPLAPGQLAPRLPHERREVQSPVSLREVMGSIRSSRLREGGGSPEELHPSEAKIKTFREMHLPLKPVTLVLS